MATIITCGAAEVDLEIPEGCDWSIVLEFRDDNGALVDLSGDTFRADIRATADAITRVNALTCTVSGLGLLALSLAEADNLNRPGTACLWSLQWDDQSSMVMHGAATWCQNPTFPAA